MEDSYKYKVQTIWANIWQTFDNSIAKAEALYLKEGDLKVYEAHLSDQVVSLRLISDYIKTLDLDTETSSCIPQNISKLLH